jgi:hypothetical protein
VVVLKLLGYAQYEQQSTEHTPEWKHENWKPRPSAFRGNLPIPKKKAGAKDIGICVAFALELMKNLKAANPRNLQSDKPG